MGTDNTVYRGIERCYPDAPLNGGEGTSKPKAHHHGCRLMGRYRHFDHQANAQRDQCRNPLVKWACLGWLGNRPRCRALVRSGEARVFLASSPPRGVFRDG